MRPKVLVITPVQHINGVKEILESFAEVTFLDDPSLEEVIEIIGSYDSIFTNPNKSKLYLNGKIFEHVRYVCVKGK